MKNTNNSGAALDNTAERLNGIAELAYRLEEDYRRSKTKPEFVNELHEIYTNMTAMIVKLKNVQIATLEAEKYTIREKLKEATVNNTHDQCQGVKGECKLQFDGACEPNPGMMGTGAVLTEDGVTVQRLSKLLADIGTNNEAEYTALIHGLDAATDRGWKDITIEGDSQLVINQVLGTWKCKAPELKRLLDIVRYQLERFGSYRMKWIPREENTVADELSTRPLRSG